MVSGLHLRDAVAGHHVPGTPDHFKHGWIPIGPDIASRPRHSRVTTAKGWLKSAIDPGHRQELKTGIASTKKRLSPAQRKTVEQWTSGKGMVRRIQTGNTSKATADAFDQAMREAPKVDGLVYRGVSADSGLARLVDKMRPGTTLRLDEPVSTSIDPGQAASFGTYMFEIDSPAAAYISGIGSKYAYEQEAVLAPGQFRVVSIENSKMHFAGHGVRPVRVVKLQDVSQGAREWRHIPRAQLNPRAAGGDMEDGDRSDRFVQGDGPGAFYIVAGTGQRTAETPIASTVHEPFGSPAGPGLFHVKGLQLPAYIQHVAHHLVASGHDESKAIGMAVGIVKNWAAGHDGKGNRIHPDVQAAAAKAVAEWEAAKAAAHGKGRASMTQMEYRAPMATADINDLPDSAFAYIEPGGSKDSSGKTVPRSKRHFPVHDASHIRDALSRAPQSPFGSKAMPAIKAAAKKAGIQVSDSDSGRAFGKPPGGGWDQYEIERRFTTVATELRQGTDGQRIGGYASVFGQPSRNLGGFIEIVGTGAFSQARSLGWPNVVCRYNHDPNMVLGTTAGRTLSLQIDSVGLDYDVLPPQSRMDILELVQRGDVQHSSFAFRVPSGGDEWTTTRDTNYPLRTLHEVQLVDVAPVLDPAYPDATAGLRSLARAMDAPLDEVRSMAEADELRRFFVRTDRPSYTPPKPKISGAAAMMRMMEKRYPDLG